MEYLLSGRMHIWFIAFIPFAKKLNAMPTTSLCLSESQVQSITRGLFLGWVKYVCVEAGMICEILHSKIQLAGVKLDGIVVIQLMVPTRDVLMVVNLGKNSNWYERCLGNFRYKKSQSDFES